jgi:hypothetical protein
VEHPSEPTTQDLAAIEAEWPLIEAELSLVDAEIRLMTAVGGPSLLDWRRLRRAEQRVMREVAALVRNPRGLSDARDGSDLDVTAAPVRRAA